MKLVRVVAAIATLCLCLTPLQSSAAPPAHHAYLVSDLRRGTDEPWLAFTGDSLLIGDVGRPDLHVAANAAGQARILHASLGRLLALSDGVVVLPSHYGGSVCGRGLSANPISTIGFERAHNPMVTVPDADAFAEALVKDMPQPPPGQAHSWSTREAVHSDARLQRAGRRTALDRDAGPVRRDPEGEGGGLACRSPVRSRPSWPGLTPGDDGIGEGGRTADVPRPAWR